MIKRFFLLALVLIAFLVFTPPFIQAKGEISLLDSATEVNFPDALIFKLKVSSSTDITKIRLHYQVDRMNYATVTSEAWPKFTPTPMVETQWVWDMRKASLPPGASMKYWWTVEDKAKNILITPEKTVCFADFNHPWQSLTSEQLTLFWYEGNNSFVQELMAACQRALEKLAIDTGAHLEKPAKIHIYASTKELQEAMIFPREWTGGVAYTEFGIIAIGIPPEQLEWGKRTVAHELAHLVVHQLTFSPYANLPTWLDEGLAMHAEGEADPYMQAWLRKAIEEDKLVSVRSLSSPFSAKPEEAYISYAQSQSLVEYLIQNYGQDKIFKLLKLFKQGYTYDEALIEVYGFDADGLDARWRTSITNQNQAFWQKVLTEILASPVGVC